MLVLLQSSLQQGVFQWLHQGKLQAWVEWRAQASAWAQRNCDKACKLVVVCDCMCQPCPPRAECEGGRDSSAPNPASIQAITLWCHAAAQRGFWALQRHKKAKHVSEERRSTSACWHQACVHSVAWGTWKGVVWAARLIGVGEAGWRLGQLRGAWSTLGGWATASTEGSAGRVTEHRRVYRVKQLQAAWRVIARETRHAEALTCREPRAGNHLLSKAWPVLEIAGEEWRRKLHSQAASRACLWRAWNMLRPSLNPTCTKAGPG